MNRRVMLGLIIIIILATSIAISQVAIEPEWEVEIFMGAGDSVTLAGAGEGDTDVVQVIPEFDDDSGARPRVISCSCSENVVSDTNENYDIFIEFNKPMVNKPDIRFSAGVFKSLGGIWENGNTQWHEIFCIESIERPHFDVMIRVSGAIDTFGNRMDDYRSEPLFDIVPPVTSHYIFSIDENGAYLDYDSVPVSSSSESFQLGCIWLDENNTVDTITLMWDIDPRMFISLTMHILGDEVNMLEQSSVDVEIMSNQIYGFNIRSVPTADGVDENNG